MSKITLAPNVSGTGTFTIAAPDSNTDRTLTLPDSTGTVATLGTTLTLATAVTASGTSVDFTGIPSWVKRITVMFSGVSTNGASHFLVQIGAGSVTSSGYVSASVTSFSGSPYNVSTSSTAGFVVYGGASGVGVSGLIMIATIVSNTWVESHSASTTAAGPLSMQGGGNITLGGTLDRVRVTTVNGTDTFDAGTINIMYEG